MKLLWRSILFLGVASLAPLASGQVISWTNTGPDDDFNNGQNWTTPTGTGTVPGPGDVVYILPGFTTVADPTNDFIDVNQGGSATITINSSTDQSIDGLAVSSNFEALTVADGVLNLNFTSGSTLTVGSEGIVVVGGSTVNFTGNLQMLTGDVEVGSTSNQIDPAQITGAGTLNFGAGTVDFDGVGGTLFAIGSGVGGTVTQSTGSVVIAGENLDIGEGGGTGVYNLTGNSVLNIGTMGDPQSSLYTVEIGSGAEGTLSIADSSTFNMANAGSVLDVGTGSTGNGTITQSGTSTVNLGGAGSEFLLGDAGGTATGAVGTYNLISGSLNMSDLFVSIAATSGSTGILAQSGGTLTADADTTFLIGDAGTGYYTLSGGTADFQGGFTVGNQAGSSGTVIQSNGTLTAEGAVVIGGAGTGAYDLEGGTATFSAGVVVGPDGSIDQTGGTLIIANGQNLDLSAAGSSYSLGGGTLEIANGALVGTSGEGTLNLAGGTLQITSAGTFTDPLDSTLTGVSTIDAATTPGVTTVTMGGNLSGSGGITFKGTAGTTVFDFAGTNTYTGPTGITSGTLDATQANITHSSALNIGSTGILNLTLAGGGFAYAGALGGSGALNVDFNTAGDPFVIKNASNYTGAITLGANGTAGTLQVYSGSYGNISDNGTGSSVTIGGAPLAAFPAGVTVPSTGTVTIGNADYTGLTTINSGFTLNADTLSGPVTNMGTLYALGSGNVTNTGSLGLLQSSAVGSTFDINGSLTSTGAGATLDIRANGTGAMPTADLILASGTVTLDSASKIDVTGTGTISTPIAIVTGTSGLTVAPGDLPQVDSTLLFDATLTRDGNSIDLTTVQLTVSSFATTPNEAAAGAPIDKAIGNLGSLSPSQLAAFNILLTAFDKFTTGSEVAHALEELTPESLQYARDISFENTTFLVERMNGIDSELRGGYGGFDTSAINVVMPGFSSGLGRSLGSLLAYNDPSFHQPAPNGVDYYPGTGGNPPGSATSPSSNPEWDSSTQVISDSPNPYLATQHPSGPEVPSMSEFISGDAVLADLNQNQSAANAPSSKASYTAGDATAGVSFRMNSHLAAGVLFDYNHTDAKTDSSGSKTHLDSYSPGLYATYFDHGFYINGLASFGYNRYSNSRDIGFVDETASSHPTGRQYVGDLDFGYDFHPNNAWIVGPTLGVTYTHLDIDSFTETGAPGADLAVDSQSADSLRSRLGGHVIYQTNTGDVLLQPNFTAMWQHEFLDNGSGITSTFNDFSTSPFTIQTAAPSRDSALIGVGLTATLSNSMALYLNYLADMGSGNYVAQSVVGGFKARF